MKEMKTKELLVNFVYVFALTFVAGVGVTYFYSLIAHGAGVIDWETSFRLAVIIGVVIGLTKQKK